MPHIYKLFASKDEVLNKIPPDYKTRAGVPIVEWAICEVENEPYLYFAAKSEKLQNHIKEICKSEYIDPETWKATLKKDFQRFSLLGNRELLR
jgi:hypothetical protein